MKDKSGQNNQVTIIIDEELYSKNLVLIFSVFFSTLVGMALLLLNFHRLGNRTGLLHVFTFGVIYTIAGITLLYLTEGNTNIAILINVGGAFILTGYFWDKHIGKNAKHPTKSWVWPFIVVTVMVFGYILLVYNTNLIS